MVLDIRGANQAPCTNIIMYPEKPRDNANQLWKLVPEKEMEAESSSRK